MNPLLLIPCEDGRPAPGAWAAVQAAQVLAPLTALVCGGGATQAAVQVASLAGVAQVLVMEAGALPRAEALAPWLAERVQAGHTHLVATAGAWARAVLPRVAALLDVMSVSDVVAVVDADTVVRPVHTGSALFTLQMAEAVQVFSVRASAFGEPAAADAAAPIDVVTAPTTAAPCATLCTRTLPAAGDGVALVGARVVVSGGRGTGSAAGFAQLQPLAQALGAALGASRAAVDAGFAPADRQVGQTGKSVAPDLYIALGISGAVQHWAGMKDSKVIVAVNKDAEAPIFQFADYGMVADLFDVLPALEAGVRSATSP